MKADETDLVYDGQWLTWKNVGKYRASSGLPGYQRTEHQCTKDAGPIPEGDYRVPVSKLHTAKDSGTGRCALTPGYGYQQIPRGAAAGVCEEYWENWGFHRIRIKPANGTTANACKPVRSGFYLHDSTKGYSHGCIEVEGAFFQALAFYVKSSSRALTLKVKYLSESTYGGTRKN